MLSFLYQKLPVLLLGFVGGIAFIISCSIDDVETSDRSSTSIINEVMADVIPVVNDQMYCINTGGDFATDETNVTDTLQCMKQSTQVQQFYTSLAGIYAEGWIMIQVAGVNNSSSFLFYK